MNNVRIVMNGMDVMVRDNVRGQTYLSLSWVSYVVCQHGGTKPEPDFSPT